ncbi:MAG: ATP-grasp domain-containing protein [Gammaproteobacteria bacterium]
MQHDREETCIVIVDPYSAGAMLAEALRARGVTCIAVESSQAIPKAMRSRFNPAVFWDIIRHEGDYGRTLGAVEHYRPAFVVPGGESGVELAEQLGHDLDLPVNGPALREARRDKYLMTEAVRTRGLRTAAQFLSRDVEEIIDWTVNTQDWPVIVKPPRSVASDSVAFCRSANEVRAAASRVLSATNVLGCQNHAVLVQAFLAGTEYVVDTVSCDGRRKTTAIWQYSRPPTRATGEFVSYDAMTLLPYAGERQEVLQSYACKVLDALEINVGPAHCELMWVDGEPVLVEAAARLSGGIGALLSGICGGICQVDETVSILLEPERFLATLNEKPCLQRRAVILFLVPHRRGRLIRIRGLDALRQLPTLHSASVGAQPGDMLKRVAGVVTLIDEDVQSIERDMGVIRALEREGMFEVESEGPG